MTVPRQGAGGQPIGVEATSCPVCGEDGHSAVPVRQIDGWRIVRCARCGAAFLNPRPAEAELPRLYGADYFTRDISEAAEDPRVLTPSEAAARVASQHGRVALIERYAPPGRLLDVGCGPGYLLAAARDRGWDVRGRELSAWAVDYARDRLNVPVEVGTAFDEPADSAAYDVVTLYHTLEHLPDPRAALARIRALLRPTGLLVVEVPNFGGVDARLYGAHWEGLRLPFHLTHFEPRSLRRLAMLAGFRVVALEPEPSRLLLESWVAAKARLGSLRGTPAARSTVTASSWPEMTESARPSRVRRVLRRMRAGIARALPGRDLTLVAVR